MSTPSQQISTNNSNDDDANLDLLKQVIAEEDLVLSQALAKARTEVYGNRNTNANDLLYASQVTGQHTEPDNFADRKEAKEAQPNDTQFNDAQPNDAQATNMQLTEVNSHLETLKSLLNEHRFEEILSLLKTNPDWVKNYLIRTELFDSLCNNRYSQGDSKEDTTEENIPKENTVKYINGLTSFIASDPLMEYLRVEIEKSFQQGGTYFPYLETYFTKLQLDREKRSNLETRWLEDYSKELIKISNLSKPSPYCDLHVVSLSPVFAEDTRLSNNMFHLSLRPLLVRNVQLNNSVVCLILKYKEAISDFTAILSKNKKIAQIQISTLGLGDNGTAGLDRLLAPHTNVKSVFIHHDGPFDNSTFYHAIENRMQLDSIVQAQVSHVTLPSRLPFRIDSFAALQANTTLQQLTICLSSHIPDFLKAISNHPSLQHLSLHCLVNTRDEYLSIQAALVQYIKIQKNLETLNVSYVSKCKESPVFETKKEFTDKTAHMGQTDQIDKTAQIDKIAQTTQTDKTDIDNLFQALTENESICTISIDVPQFFMKAIDLKEGVDHMFYFLKKLESLCSENIHLVSFNFCLSDEIRGKLDVVKRKRLRDRLRNRVEQEQDETILAQLASNELILKSREPFVEVFEQLADHYLSIDPSAQQNISFDEMKKIVESINAAFARNRALRYGVLTDVQTAYQLTLPSRSETNVISDKEIKTQVDSLLNQALEKAKSLENKHPDQKILLLLAKELLRKFANKHYAIFVLEQVPKTCHYYIEAQEELAAIALTFCSYDENSHDDNSHDESLSSNTGSLDGSSTTSAAVSKWTKEPTVVPYFAALTHYLNILEQNVLERSLVTPGMLDTPQRLDRIQNEADTHAKKLLNNGLMGSADSKDMGSADSKEKKSDNSEVDTDSLREIRPNAPTVLRLLEIIRLQNNKLRQQKTELNTLKSGNTLSSGNPLTSNKALNSG